MSVIFDKEKKIFHLQTRSSSYIISIYKDVLLRHIYYGKRINSLSGIENLIPKEYVVFGINSPHLNYSAVDEAISQEYPTFGCGDLRMPAFHAEFEDGSSASALLYKKYKIFSGKNSLSSMPSVYTETQEECVTLEIELTEAVKNVTVILSYSVFEEYDAIVRSVKIINNEEYLNIKSALSMTIDIDCIDMDFVHLHGRWAKERNIERASLIHGKMEVDSKRGSSSHMHSPFFALCDNKADENNGNVYGFSLVYSGNFSCGAEVSSTDTVRAYMGINPFDFNWLLEEGEIFETPEVVMVYSDCGFNKMSQIYHKLYRERMCRGYWRDRERPILINNWEATYFNFNEEKILNIASEAKQLGVELMVLDDGWFGRRDREDSSLGDWYVDKRKLPNGLSSLANNINKLGMKFGLWFEPEMISPDSDLYRNHPDWCLHIEGRKSSLGRNQLVLDLSRQDVCDYVVEAVSDVLNSANIEYVKWDFNRNLSEIGSTKLPANRQHEISHRYVLGLYSVLERLTKAFPRVLFEGCSGGGGRYDAAMLAYFPQYWTSDDSDAVERIEIQYGTSLVMPSVTMGAHVSAVPNHQVGRCTSLSMRGHVAMVGQFGYELDLGLLSKEEKEEVKKQINLYKSIRKIVHNGKMYRISSPFEKNNTDWIFVSDEKTKAVFFHFNVLGKPNPNSYVVKLSGLSENKIYQERTSEKVYSGDVLMNVGLIFSDNKDFSSEVYFFEEVM